MSAWDQPQGTRCYVQIGLEGPSGTWEAAALGRGLGLHFGVCGASLFVMGAPGELDITGIPYSMF